MIGLYLRLSVADGDLKDDKTESNSIENQRTLLTSYVEEHFTNADTKEYSDDGYSGTNFDRPAFQELMEDCKRGVIDTIIVKDLSRLGRDYIDVGNYLEQIFPLLNIRFIAIASNYDSSKCIGNTSGLDVSIQNLVNTMYCQDISRKYKAAVRTKWKEGKSTTWRAPYGYLSDSEKKANKIIDPEASKYVRFIFDQAIAGVNTRAIAEKLNTMGVKTPADYMAEKGIAKPVNVRSIAEERHWDAGKVARIIRKYEYTGALVQGKTGNIKVGSRKYRKLPDEDVYIVDGVYEPIVTIEEYEKAQKVLVRNERKPNATHDYALKGKLVCGHCKRKMTITYNKGWPRVNCRYKASSGDFSDCDNTRYQLKEIDALVFDILRKYLSHMLDLIDIYEEFQDKTGAYTKEAEMLAMSIKSAKSRQIYLYEDYANGNLSRDAYKKEKELVNDRILTMSQRYESLQNLLHLDEELQQERSSVKLSADKVLKGEKLTREMVDAFIDQIIIYDPTHWEIVYSCEDLYQHLLGLDDMR